MEEKFSNSSDEGVGEKKWGLGEISNNWWWGIASAAQLGLGIRSFRKGVGDSNFMPLKAFTVASLFVGAGGTAFFGTLRAFGIYKVEDLKAVGSSIGTAIRAPPRERAE